MREFGQQVRTWALRLHPAVFGRRCADASAERMERETPAFRLVLQLAAGGDSVDDPTAAWPQERETVVAGRLELTGLERQRERGGDVLVFDPTRVCDGIECSHDPVLLFRSRAYSVSVERRTAIASPTD